MLHPQKTKFSDTNLRFEKNLMPTFQLNTSVVIRAKVKEVRKTSTYYLVYTLQKLLSATVP